MINKKIDMTLNRTTAPALTPLSIPELLDYSIHTLSNGIKVYVLHDENQEVFKLDVVFNAGTYYQPYPLVALSTVNMLNEGTPKYNSLEIAENFDFYGAYIDFSSGFHKSEISLFSLVKYAQETIPVMGEIITESIFPAEELSIFLRNKKQRFLTQLQKTSYLARKEFTKVLFGENHPYAEMIKVNDFDKVDRESLKTFFNERYSASHCHIILAGNITPTVMKTVETVFSHIPLSKTEESYPEILVNPALPGNYGVKKEGAVQFSIRIGKQGVGLTDKDYAGFQLLNTLLGGYFGSRLMSNIREEKGYTYGIYSFNFTLPLANYWGVTTDVNKEFEQATIDEVLKEIQTLQNTPVSADELHLVKNYFYGEL
ncbi:MAG: insulinase family protein, partial [Odoribacter sp.]|nr:insulinase family protein [Odoribacter sp.]